jgi:cell wall-associated NlpC family hydrolase
MGWIVFGLALPFVVEAKTVRYTVKKGDTLIAIAKKYHMKVSDLKRINRLDSSMIKAGQRLKVVVSKPARKTLKANKKNRKAKKLAKTLIRTKRHKPMYEHPAKRRPKTLSDIVFAGLGYDTDGVSPKSQRIIELAKKELGKRYVWGAAGKNAFDCSGLTSYVCKQNGIKLPRRAIEQSKVGLFVPRDQLQPGDLVFFDTSKQRRGYVNHVGIYIGNGKFIHASSAKKKVIITSLDKPFYKSRYKGARRVVASL